MLRVWRKGSGPGQRLCARVCVERAARFLGSPARGRAARAGVIGARVRAAGRPALRVCCAEQRPPFCPSSPSHLMAAPRQRGGDASAGLCPPIRTLFSPRLQKTPPAPLPLSAVPDRPSPASPKSAASRPPQRRLTAAALRRRACMDSKKNRPAVQRRAAAWRRSPNQGLTFSSPLPASTTLFVPFFIPPAQWCDLTALCLSLPEDNRRTQQQCRHQNKQTSSSVKSVFYKGQVCSDEYKGARSNLVPILNLHLSVSVSCLV